MQKFSGTSLKTRLYLLVLAAFMPVAGLIFYIAEEQKTIETKVISHKTMMLARSMAGDENHRLESTVNLLATVADALLLSPDRAERLSGLLSDILERSEAYADMGILDPGGAPAGQRGPFDGRPALRR